MRIHNPPRLIPRVSLSCRFLVGCLVILGLASIALPATAADRPNVLIIYGDDQGSIDMGCYGWRTCRRPISIGWAPRGYV